MLGRNKEATLPKYDSPLTMASVMNTFFIDKIDNIRAGFPLLEANLLIYFNGFYNVNVSYWFISFDHVTDTELLNIISCKNKTTCSSDPFPTSLLMFHIHAIVPILLHIINLCLTTFFFLFLVNHLL